MHPTCNLIIVDCCSGNHGDAEADPKLPRFSAPVLGDSVLLPESRVGPMVAEVVDSKGLQYETEVEK